MNISDKRRANIARIFINIATIIFATLVISNFTSVFSLNRLAVASGMFAVCCAIAVWVER